MNRAIVIGAGFSKAIANAPLVNELFGLIYQKTKGDDETRPQWHVDRQHFLDVVCYLQNQAKPLIDFLERDGTQIETYKDIPDLYPINIEYLCTILDLNIERPYVPKGIGVDLKSCPIPFMRGLTVDQLRGARDFITYYIVKLLLPDRLTPDKDLLDRTLSFVDAGDVVITFNYDLLVEQALWRKKLWNPLDGYGIGEIEKYEEIDASNLTKSKVSVIKLHGSVNWGHEIEIYTTHPFTNEPLFEGLKVKSNRVIPKWNYPLTHHVVIPTYMKSVRQRWELQLVKMASEAISKAKEIFILGYSFPEADAMASFIFTPMKEDAHIKIVDKYNAIELAGRFAKNYGIRYENIIFEQSDIKTWADNNFKYKAYEEEISKRKEIESFINFAKNNL